MVFTADFVFLKKEDERYEYVLNETGRVYKAKDHKKRIRAKPWNFGQMEEACLQGALYLLENSTLGTERHGNPVLVTRALSAQVRGGRNILLHNK